MPFELLTQAWLTYKWAYIIYIKGMISLSLYLLGLPVRNISIQQLEERYYDRGIYFDTINGIENKRYGIRTDKQILNEDKRILFINVYFEYEN